jgi:hypothetical protein
VSLPLSRQPRTAQSGPSPIPWRARGGFASPGGHRPEDGRGGRRLGAGAARRFQSRMRGRRRRGRARPLEAAHRPRIANARPCGGCEMTGECVHGVGRMGRAVGGAPAGMLAVAPSRPRERARTAVWPAGRLFTTLPLSARRVCAHALPAGTHKTKNSAPTRAPARPATARAPRSHQASARRERPGVRVGWRAPFLPRRRRSRKKKKHTLPRPPWRTTAAAGAPGLRPVSPPQRPRAATTPAAGPARRPRAARRSTTASRAARSTRARPPWRPSCSPSPRPRPCWMRCRKARPATTR